MPISPTPENAAHLLRRAAWGGRPAEIQQVVDEGIEASVARLLDATRAPELGEPVRTNGYVPYDGEALVGWFGRAAIESPTPAIERLLWFWHGHFATSLDKVELVDLMLRQWVTLRRCGLGRFDDLLNAVSQDAAMNVWLDLHLSVVGNPNENFARELLELFSMGASNGYTQQDVVETARAFTGYALESDPTYYREVGARLVPAFHDYGAKTIFGRTGPFDGSDVIEMVVERPECHRFIAGRFWHRYAGTAPREDVLDGLAASFASRLEIGDLLTALLTHPRFYDDDVKAGLVAQPVEVAIRTFRGFELTIADVTAHSVIELDEREEDLLTPGVVHPGTFIEWTSSMGQVPGFPPNVGGWPHNEAWLDSNRAAGRLLAGTELGNWVVHDELPVAEPLRRAAAGGAAALTSELMARFGRVGWTAETEAAIGAALGDGDAGGLAAAIAVAFTSVEVTLA